MMWLLVLVDDVNGPITRSDRVATLEEAKAQFLKALTVSWLGRNRIMVQSLAEGRPATGRDPMIGLQSSRKTLGLQ
jgi:hypothetical protein